MKPSVFEEWLENADRRPARFRPLRDATHRARFTGPCGDTAEFFLRIDAGRIRRAAYLVEGCAASVACCDAAARLAEGKTPAEARAVTPGAVLEKAGPIPPDHHHCARLAVETLRRALDAPLPPRRPLLQRLRTLFGKQPSNRNGGTTT